MKTAIVDTTVLTDALLKSGEQARRAKAAIASFDRTELPVYAIKELKAGPISAYIWLHNKLVATRSFAAAVDALHKISMLPRRYFTSSAIEALKEAAIPSGEKTLKELEKTYGEAASWDKVQADQLRLSLESRVLRAWKKRRSTTTDVVYPLSCYPEINPRTEEDGTIEKGRLACESNADCDLAKHLRTRADQGQKIRTALQGLPQKTERDRSKKALKDALKNRFISNNACRSIGDAAFAILCPDDGVILTTNIVDHRPLAQAVGKRALTPQEAIDEANRESSKM